MNLLVTADDRTGAYETAAVLADRTGEAVEARAWPDLDDLPAVAVVDLGSRSLDSHEAARRVVAADRRDVGRRAHKIDSVLRGNWATEIAALSADRPVLLVPALPALGRTCEGGVVRSGGLPVGDRPAQSLGLSPGSSRLQVTEADSSETVAAWLERPGGVCVADATTDADIDRHVARWREVDGVVLAGTSAVIGAVPSIAVETMATATVDGPILVVCGSLHEAARRQLAALAGTDLDAVVMASPEPHGPVSQRDAATIAHGLAHRARRWLAEHPVGAIVVIGGDTAAALIGTERVAVRGSVTPGSAYGIVPSLGAPVVTRSGGFGDDAALITLIRATLRS